MLKSMTVRAIQQELENLLAQMSPGETLTVLGDDGVPQAVVVRIQVAGPHAVDAWAELEKLGEEMSSNWPAGKSAAEAVAEIRR